MNKTISAFLAEALTLDESEETPETKDDVQVVKTASVKTASGRDPRDLVATLRYIGGHGIEKIASAMPGNNAQMSTGLNQPRFVPHNPNSGSEGASRSGPMPENNKTTAITQAGDAAASLAHEKGTPPELSSNQAAMDYDIKSNIRRISPALSSVLSRAKPWSDPKVKEVLDTTATDPNIHSGKSKTASSALHNRLARRLTAQEA